MARSTPLSGSTRWSTLWLVICLIGASLAITEGADAHKGWEFANFAFGGSDFVVLFEKQADFVLTVEPLDEEAPGTGVNYPQSYQGEKYGCFDGDPGCPDKPEEFPDAYPGCESPAPAE